MCFINCKVIICIKILKSRTEITVYLNYINSYLLRVFFNFLHIFKHVPTKFQGAFVDVCPYFVSWLYVTRKEVYTEIVALVYEKRFLLGKYLQYTIFFF